MAKKNQLITRKFLTMTFISAIIRFTFSLRGSIAALYFRSLGISIVDIGVISMFGAIGFAVFEPTLGFLSDKINRKKFLIFGMLGVSIITFLYTLGSTVWHFYLLSFFMSAVMAGVTVSTRALIATVLPSSKKGRSYGLYMAIASIGGIIAPIIGGYLAGAINYYVPFYLGALIIFFDMSKGALIIILIN